ncbi:hypothetical protein FIBSPDRAFT_945970 [Athelia psychrophila]|uniref:DRBM domain-containing protein n=1 Tax=Athelia psychrophila TaxID=1759441 RepID=A0A166TI03_9AGAM|nr:hypothetical protein FIBSPDRAFT_945970 [Fibularhizoctonia sp. CBS 109695]
MSTFRIQLNNYIQDIYRVNDAVTYTQKQIGNVWKVKCYIKDNLYGEATSPTVAEAKENAAEQALIAHRAGKL